MNKNFSHPITFALAALVGLALFVAAPPASQAGDWSFSLGHGNLGFSYGDHHGHHKHYKYHGHSHFPHSYTVPHHGHHDHVIWHGDHYDVIHHYPSVRYYSPYRVRYY